MKNINDFLFNNFSNNFISLNNSLLKKKFLIFLFLFGIPPVSMFIFKIFFLIILMPFYSIFWNYFFLISLYFSSFSYFYVYLQESQKLLFFSFNFKKNLIYVLMSFFFCFFLIFF